MTIDIALSKFAKRVYEKNYTEKKKTESGGVVRIYDEKHLAKRSKEKVQALKKLEKSIGALRKKYHSDLKSDDPKIRAIAAIVGIIELTAMRVGNSNSADEFETFGATTLEKQHARVSGSKIRFKFKGKKGVDQDHSIDDAAVVKEVKALLEGKKKTDLIFEYEEGKSISAKVVNRYLAEFDITAKDIRSLGANARMKKELKQTKDFEEALENVAEDIGHTTSVLERQYLDPALVKKYKKASLDNPIATFESMIEDILKYDIPVVVRNKADISSGDKTHRMTSQFGPRASPITGKYVHHDGIDLAAHVGDVVYAITDGTVARAGWQDPENHRRGFGKRVYIDHGDELVSIYGHLSETYVKKGDVVAEGMAIGEAGHTGSSTGPHLHFELHYKGKAIDPTELLVGRRVI